MAERFLLHSRDWDCNDLGSFDKSIFFVTTKWELSSEDENSDVPNDTLEDVPSTFFFISHRKIICT